MRVAHRQVFPLHTVKIKIKKKPACSMMRNDCIIDSFYRMLAVFFITTLLTSLLTGIGFAFLIVSCKALPALSIQLFQWPSSLHV